MYLNVLEVLKHSINKIIYYLKHYCAHDNLYK